MGLFNWWRNEKPKEAWSVPDIKAPDPDEPWVNPARKFMLGKLNKPPVGMYSTTDVVGDANQSPTAARDSYFQTNFGEKAPAIEAAYQAADFVDNLVLLHAWREQYDKWVESGSKGDPPPRPFGDATDPGTIHNWFTQQDRKTTPYDYRVPANAEQMIEHLGATFNAPLFDGPDDPAYKKFEALFGTRWKLSPDEIVGLAKAATNELRASQDKMGGWGAMSGVRQTGSGLETRASGTAVPVRIGATVLQSLSLGASDLAGYGELLDPTVTGQSSTAGGLLEAGARLAADLYTFRVVGGVLTGGVAAPKFTWGGQMGRPIIKPLMRPDRVIGALKRAGLPSYGAFSAKAMAGRLTNAAIFGSVDFVREINAGLAAGHIDIADTLQATALGMGLGLWLGPTKINPGEMGFGKALTTLGLESLSAAGKGATTALVAQSLDHLRKGGSYDVVGIGANALLMGLFHAYGARKGIRASFALRSEPGFHAQLIERMGYKARAVDLYTRKAMGGDVKYEQALGARPWSKEHRRLVALKRGFNEMFQSDRLLLSADRHALELEAMLGEKMGDLDAAVAERAKVEPRQLDLPGMAEPRTQSQLKEAHQLESALKDKYDDGVRRSMKLAVTNGRTHTMADFTRGEAQTYIDMLRGGATDVQLADLAARPVTHELMETMARAEQMSDPSLARLANHIEQQSRKFYGKAVSVAYPKKLNQIVDVATAMARAQEQYGIPLWNLYRRINRVGRDAIYDAEKSVEKVFEGTDVDPMKFGRDEAGQRRVFDALVSGDASALKGEFEAKVYGKVKETLEAWKLDVRRMRHRKWMRTHNDTDLPPNENGRTTEETRALLQEGERLYKMDPEAGLKGENADYETWVGTADFGTRNFYAPTYGKQHGRSIFNRRARVSRRHLKTGGKERPEYDPEYPLVERLYKYVLGMTRLRDVEPLLDKLDSIMDENNFGPHTKSAVGRFRESTLGVRPEHGALYDTMAHLTGTFMKAITVAKLPYWFARNRLQPFTFVIPKTFAPFDKVWRKNLGKLFTEGWKYGFRRKVLERDPELLEQFQRYVDTLKSSYQHKFLQQYSKYEMVNVGKFLRFYDRVASVYGLSDSMNRWDTFMFGFSTAKDGINRWHESKTPAERERNLDALFKATGFRNANAAEKLDILAKMDRGEFKEAAFDMGSFLSNTTQFRYLRQERPLLVHDPIMRIAFPFLTFARSYAEHFVWKQGIDPIIRFTKGAATAKEAAGSAKTLLTLFATSYIATQFTRYMYGVDPKNSPYDPRNILDYSGGSPALEAVTDTWTGIKDPFLGLLRGEGVDIAPLVRAAETDFRSFLPYYITLERLTGFAVGGGRAPANYKLVMRLFNALGAPLSKAAGSDKPLDQATWVDLNSIELIQEMLFDTMRPTKAAQLKAALDKDDYGEFEYLMRRYPTTEGQDRREKRRSFFKR